MTGEPTTPIASGTFRTGVLVVLVVIIVAALGALAWLTVDRHDGDPRRLFSASDGVQAERDPVMKQARAFMLRMNTYGPDLLDGSGKRMPEYREQLLALVSDKFGADFEANGAPLAEATVAQQGLARTAEVYAVGVKRLDEDSATVLVAGSFTNSYPETPGSQKRVTLDPQPYRVQVQLVDVDGEWLVDSFAPVQSPGQSGGGSPSSAPTEGGTP